MKTFVRILLAAGLYASAHAEITTYVEWYQPYIVGDDPLAPNFNGNHWTVDLYAVVSDGDDWTSAEAQANIPRGEFFYHPLGDRTPPLTGVTQDPTALRYDTMVMSTQVNHNNNPPQADPDGIVNGDFGARKISVEAWFGIPPNGGDGDYLIARYTIHAEEDELPVTFHVWGANTTRNGWGTLYPFDFRVEVPEPGTLALLGVATALLRRH